MWRLIGAVVIICIISKFQYSTGYKWITLSSDNPIPKNVIIIDSNHNKHFVGRARHFNLVLPAEVHNRTHAIISFCSQEIVKHQFEVLVATEHCEWQYFDDVQHVPVNIVRAGTNENGQPIFIGKSENCDWHISQIYLSSNEVKDWIDCDGRKLILTCDDKNNWVDTSSANIPNNTIAGGKTADDYDIYVARLLNGCSVVTGQVIPELNISTALVQGKIIKSDFCQVLVGDSSEYIWVPAYNGEIPDYAVVAGKSNSGELSYVARINKTIENIEHTRAVTKKMAYEVLVRYV